MIKYKNNFKLQYFESIKILLKKFLLFKRSENYINKYKLEKQKIANELLLIIKNHVETILLSDNNFKDDINFNNIDYDVREKTLYVGGGEIILKYKFINNNTFYDLTIIGSFPVYILERIYNSLKKEYSIFMYYEMAQQFQFKK